MCNVVNLINVLYKCLIFFISQCDLFMVVFLVYYIILKKRKEEKTLRVGSYTKGKRSVPLEACNSMHLERNTRVK